MNWQRPPPPPSFPQPYVTHRPSNPAQNEASNFARPQDSLPFGHGYPPMHNTSVSSSQVYSSRPQPPPSRRSTQPMAPAYEHGSSFHRQPAPPPSGSISHHQSFPTRYAPVNSLSPPPPMMQRATTIPMPVHPNALPSMPYNVSPHPPSRSEMSRGPQHSSQRGESWSYLDVNEGEGDSSDFSDGDPEHSPEARKRSPPSLPFASRKSKSHGKHLKKGSASGSPATDQLPCRLCQKLSQRNVIEYWGGFCSERHKTQWMAQ